MLDRLGLLCITSAQADMLSPISPEQEPFTCALEAAAKVKGSCSGLMGLSISACTDVMHSKGAAAKLQQVPLQQLVCPEQMGQPALSDLLATNLPAPPNRPEPGNAIWLVLS